MVLAIEAGPTRNSPHCRVVYARTQPRRHGFACGTLQGAQSQASRRHDRAAGDGIVEFTITAIYRPATAMARAAGPPGCLAQLHYTQRYLRAPRTTPLMRSRP
jgi:uncharacterized protein (UPF0548 family)